MSWQRKILRVNLTEGTCITESLKMKWAQEYLGQRGLGTKYLLEEMNPAADALSLENKLIFATGPLTGTMASTGGRCSVITKGALTGAIACSNSGGKFGAERISHNIMVLQVGWSMKRLMRWVRRAGWMILMRRLMPVSCVMNTVWIRFRWVARLRADPWELLNVSRQAPHSRRYTMRDFKSLSHTRWECKYHISFYPKIPSPDSLRPASQGIRDCFS